MFFLIIRSRLPSLFGRCEATAVVITCTARYTKYKQYAKSQKILFWRIIESVKALPRVHFLIETSLPLFNN